MSLIPFRTKRSSGMEPGSLATLADFRNEMNRLFEGFFSRPLLAPSWFETTEPGQWLPAVDLSENDKEDRLVISGEKKTAKEATGEGWMHRESHYGAFSRAIPLPEAVDPAKVTARYDKGVLTVELTKSPASASRKVPVLAS